MQILKFKHQNAMSHPVISFNSLSFWMPDKLQHSRIIDQFLPHFKRTLKCIFQKRPKTCGINVLSLRPYRLMPSITRFLRKNNDIVSEIWRNNAILNRIKLIESKITTTFTAAQSLRFFYLREFGWHLSLCERRPFLTFKIDFWLRVGFIPFHHFILSHLLDTFCVLPFQISI